MTTVEALSETALQEQVMETALLLGAGSAVMYQLALVGVGRGVAEHSTTLERPLDRLRTTLTYVYGVALGTEEERKAIGRMVNRAHVPVKGEGYSAFDPDLQLWVAATLSQVGEDMYEKVFGPQSDQRREAAYRQSWALGSTLQVTDEMWPPTRADFSDYWDQMLTRLTPDPAVQHYARLLLTPRPEQWYLAPLVAVQSLVTRGNLSPEVRTVLDLPWNDRDQRRYDAFWRIVRATYPRLPKWLRTLYPRLVLRGMRQRMKKGRRVI